MGPGERPLGRPPIGAHLAIESGRPSWVQGPPAPGAQPLPGRIRLPDTVFVIVNTGCELPPHSLQLNALYLYFQAGQTRISVGMVLSLRGAPDIPEGGPMGT